MYTVASKNSLAKRESRWIRDDETIKHIETPDKTHKCKDNLISDDDILLSNDNNLPILPAMLSSSNNNDILNNKITQLEDQMIRLDKLEQEIMDQSDLISRFDKLDQRIQNLEHISSMNYIVSRILSIEQTLNNLVLTKPVREEFIPYFVKECYAGKDNRTSLIGKKFDMAVEILGLCDDVPIIYPFGNEIDLPKIKECHIEMNFTDAINNTGSISGTFKCGSDNIYIIHFTKDNLLEMRTYPLLLRCNCELSI